MKKLLFTLAAVAAFTIPASAGFQSLDLNQTNNVILVLATNSITGNTLVATGGGNQSATLAIQATFSCMASNTGSLVTYFDYSLDNSRWVTNALQWNVTAAGTLVTGAVTNITVGAVPFIRLNRVGNTGVNDGIITNLVISGYVKSGI